VLWLSRQRKGQAADWTLGQPTGGTSAVQEVSK